MRVQHRYQPQSTSAQTAVQARSHPNEAAIEAPALGGHNFGEVDIQPPTPAVQSSSSDGSLPSPVQQKMEAAYGVDFSDVRIHEGSEAKDIGALAYTQGSEIHFAPGKYDPHSQAGQELIGHELAHVVQQRMGRVPTPQDGLINADPSLEAEADALGAKAAQGEAATSQSAGAGNGAVQRQAIQRQEDEDGSLLGSIITTGLGFLPGGVGKAIGSTVSVGRSMEAGAQDDTWGAILNGAKTATGIAGLAAEIGGFSMLGAGGLGGLASSISSGGLGVLGTVGGVEGSALTMSASSAMAGAGLEGAAALGPAAAVLGAGLAGAGAGVWLGENTRAGDTTASVWGGIDSGLTWGAEALGLMDEQNLDAEGRDANGHYRTPNSALLSAAEWAEENPLLAAGAGLAAAPIALPALLGVGAAGLVGAAGSAAVDYGGQALDYLFGD